MTTKPRFWYSSRPPEIDPRNTGVTFVDVLFALVVGKILDVSTSGALPGAAIGHLLVGAVLTITSWVGYHNSVNRVRYFLRFWNLPIFMFLVDILLVYDYWLVPVTAQHQVAAHNEPEVLSTTTLVAIAAGLYVVWDFIALRIRKSDKYKARPEGQDIPYRRYPSMALFGLTVAVLGVVYYAEPCTTAPVVLIDVLLIVLLLAYRTLKERLTPPEALRSDGSQVTS
jgi:hypothetical protein